MCRFRSPAFCSVCLADAIWSGILASLQDCAPRHQIRELHDSGRLGVNWRVAEHFLAFLNIFLSERGVKMNSVLSCKKTLVHLGGPAVPRRL